MSVCICSVVGHSGSWTSSKPILSIHPVSGGAIALATGITTVTYSLLDGYSTSTEVIPYNPKFLLFLFLLILFNFFVLQMSNVGYRND